MLPITIRKKIFLGFLFILLMSTLFFVISYRSLNELTTLSLEVEPLSDDIATLREQIESASVIESNLESYLLVGSEEHKKILIKEIDDFVNKTNEICGQSEKNCGNELLLKMSKINEYTEALIDSMEKGTSAFDVNKQTIKIYTLLDEIKEIQEDLIRAKTDVLDANINKQHEIIASLINRFAVVEIFIVLFGFFLSFLLSGVIISGLSKLAKATREISQGRFETKIRITSRDEIGELASAFKQMAKDLKKSREQIKKHAQELEQKVKERTKELNQKVRELTDTKTAVLNMMDDMDHTNKELVHTQEKLKESLKKLKEMDAKKDQFISIAAHELKTPLTSIHGFSQLLQNRKIANNFNKRNRYLKIMDHETRRLANLVNDILDLSRIDLGTVKLVLEKVNINELMSNMKREMEMLIKEKGLESKFIIEKGMPEIITDKERLTQILINLINNAIKYTPKGKITVKVAKEKNNVHFMVKDTGIGISKENQKKIFERFYQVDSSYTRKVGGTGLGLALVKELLDILGGKIWVKSVPEKGSEFHFTLPVNRTSVRHARKNNEYISNI